MLIGDPWSDGETVSIVAGVALEQEIDPYCFQTKSSRGFKMSDNAIFPSPTLAIFEWR